MMELPLVYSGPLAKRFIKKKPKQKRENNSPDKFLLWEWEHSQGHSLGIARLFERQPNGDFHGRVVTRRQAMAYASHWSKTWVGFRGKDCYLYGDIDLFYEA